MAKEGNRGVGQINEKLHKGQLLQDLLKRGESTQVEEVEQGKNENI